MTRKHTQTTLPIPHTTAHPTPPHITSRTDIHITIPQTDANHHNTTDTDRQTRTEIHSKNRTTRIKDSHRTTKKKQKQRETLE